jgi:hypothetical protein
MTTVYYICDNLRNGVPNGIDFIIKLKSRIHSIPQRYTLIVL